jgi:hypothetical protein
MKNITTMKAKLTFNLPEDQEDFKLACQAVDLKQALIEIGMELRSLHKYGELPVNQWEIIGQVRDRYNSILNEYNIEI